MIPVGLQIGLLRKDQPFMPNLEWVSPSETAYVFWSFYRSGLSRRTLSWSLPSTTSNQTRQMTKYSERQVHVSTTHQVQTRMKHLQEMLFCWGILEPKGKAQSSKVSWQPRQPSPEYSQSFDRWSSVRALLPAFCPSFAPSFLPWLVQYRTKPPWAWTLTAGPSDCRTKQKALCTGEKYLHCFRINDNVNSTCESWPEYLGTRTPI